jgi:hypothetical protein
MLGDSILIALGMALMLLGIQPMVLNTDDRHDPVKVITTIILVASGIFIFAYWNNVTV